MASQISSLEAEAGVLGCILLDALKLMPVAMRHAVKCEWFTTPAHQAVWWALAELWNDRNPIDCLTLEEKLKVNDKMNVVGTMASLEKLIDSAIVASNGEYYLDIVRQKYILRQEVKVAQTIILEAASEERGDEHLKTIPDRFLGIISDVQVEPSNLVVLTKSIDKWKEAKKHNKPAIGLELPWSNMTELLCGLEPGITIIAGRPSAGKTTMEDCISNHAAELGVPVARVTLDSTRDELLQRATCRKAGVSLPKLKFGFATESQLASCREAADEIGKLPMWITDRERDIRGISSWIREKHLKHNIGLITLDFVQLVDAGEMGRAAWDRVQKVSFVSSALKALSIELNVPMIVLSQLSRSPEKDGNSGKKGTGARLPMMSDLRDSGSLEQDAHKIVFLYPDDPRKKEMEEEDPGCTRKLRPIWADTLKHKDGECGRLPFWMYAPYFRFEPCGESFPWPGEEAKKKYEESF